VTVQISSDYGSDHSSYALLEHQGDLPMRPVSLLVSAASVFAITGTLLITPAQMAGAQEIEEILVTARKREESLQDVPISVQAFSGEEITQQGIVDIQMLAPYTPSFAYTPSPGASDLYFMRGLGTFGSGVHFEPGVGQVFNGYFSTRGRLGRSALVDVAQVEMLKGPQGAIIGKNTSLGAINITPNKPTDEIEGSVGVQYNLEASEGYEVDAVLSGPLSDSFRGRAVVNYRDVDGWVHNVSNGVDAQSQKDLTARLMLDIDITENFSAELMYQRTDYDREGKARMPAGCQEFGPFSPARAESFGFNCTLTDTNHTLDLRRNSAGGTLFDSREPFTLENDFWGATLTWDQESFEIKSLTSYFVYDITDTFSGDQRDIERVSIQNAENYNQFYQEFRISSISDGTANYTAGVMYFDGQMDMTQTFHAVMGAIGPPFSPPMARHEFAGSQTESYAAFGQVDWQLSDTFTLTVGGRYTDEDRDGRKAQRPGEIYSIPTEFDLGLCNNPIQPLSGCTMGNDGMTLGGAITGALNETKFSYNVSLQYALSDTTNLYFTHATGFKSGGFDLRGAGNPAKFIFQPEESANYEIGGKHTLADGSVRFNWAIFLTDVDDLQSAANDPVIIQQIVAQGDAGSAGAELDLLWALTDHFRFSFVGTYLQAEYDNFTGSCYAGQFETGTGCVFGGMQGPVAIGTQDLAGKQMVFAPDWSHVLGADWNFPVGGDKDLSLGIKWLHVGDHFTSIERDPLGFQDSTNRFDASIALAGEAWEIALVGRNLTNELVHNFGNATSLSGNMIYATNIEETRAVALRATFNW
jgi:outer membrane receptor protein involved in Fe transport